MIYNFKYLFSIASGLLLTSTIAMDLASGRERPENSLDEGICQLKNLLHKPDIYIPHADEPKVNGLSGHELELMRAVDVNFAGRVVQEAGRDTAMSRCMGAMVGMAVGDTIGAPMEFSPVVDDPNTPGFVLQGDQMAWHHTTPVRNGSWYRGQDSNSRTTQGIYELGGAFGLKPGQWTDDASMGLCMADSLIIHERYNGPDIRKRFWLWNYRRYNNAFERDGRHPRDHEERDSVGLGGNIGLSLRVLQAHQEPPPKYESDTEDAGNGSLMRLAAMPVFYSSWSIYQAMDYAEEMSYTTHPGKQAAFCARLMTYIIHATINREAFLQNRDHYTTDVAVPVSQFLDIVVTSYEQDDRERRWRRENFAHQPDVLALFEAFLKGTWEDFEAIPDKNKYSTWAWKEPSSNYKPATMLEHRGNQFNGYPVSPGYFGSYAPDGLAIALHVLYTTNSFDEALIKIVNYRGDCDSTGSILAQMAGAYYGYGNINRVFVELLNRYDDNGFAARAILLRHIGMTNRPQPDEEAEASPEVEEAEASPEAKPIETKTAKGGTKTDGKTGGKTGKKTDGKTGKKTDGKTGKKGEDSDESQETDSSARGYSAFLGTSVSLLAAAVMLM